MTSRRAFLSRLAAAGAAAAGGLFLLRDRLPGSAPELVFRTVGGTPWLPILGDGLLPVAAVTLAGVQAKAVVDTGAEISAVDGALARRLGLRPTFALPYLAYGVSGGPALSRRVATDVALPGLLVGGLHPAALDLAALARASGRDFSMILGRDVLERCILDLDLPQRRLRLIPRGPVKVGPDAIAVSLRQGGGAPRVEVRINGRGPFMGLIDTGSSGALTFSRAAARRSGLRIGASQARGPAAIGLGGPTTGFPVQVADVQIGDHPFGAASGLVLDGDIGAGEADLLVGSGFLGRFRHLVDIEGRRLMIYPPPVTLASADH